MKFLQYLQELRNPPEIAQFKGDIKHIDKVDNRQSDWRETLDLYFDDYGFKNVGEGKYGSVFVNKSYPYAIKIFMKDTPYIKFIQFCLQNQDNPYVPKIRGKVVKISPIIFAIRIEKLMNRQIMVTQQDITADRHFKTCMRYPKEFLRHDPQYSSPIYDNDPHMIKLCHFLADNSTLLDTHDGNIMYRGKIPVVVDPLYNFFRMGNFSIDPNDLTPFKDVF